MLHRKNLIKNPFFLLGHYSQTNILLRWLGEKGANKKWQEFVLPKNHQIRWATLNDLKRLTKRRLIRVKDNKVLFSKKGVAAFMALRVLQTSPLPSGQICLLAFDIPEKKRILRKFLRSFLKAADFERLQKSVWFSHFDASGVLNEYFSYLGLSKQIIVLTAFVDR
jgi:hypothetical protein